MGPARTITWVSESGPVGWMKPGAERRVKAGIRAEGKRRECTRAEGSREEGIPGFSDIVLESDEERLPWIRGQGHHHGEVVMCPAAEAEPVQRLMLPSGTRGPGRWETELLPNL